MNLAFVHPILLWATAAASLPVIIHLINRRRARRISFSATYFVNLSNRRLARSLKLKQLLLLALRTLLLLLLPLMLARPYRLPPAGELVDEQSNAPASRILVLDASLSMRASLDGETLFERAKLRAADLIRTFADHDNFSVIQAPLPEEEEPLDLTFDRRLALETIEDMKPGYLATDFERAMDRARLLLESSVIQENRIYVIGDGTRMGYDREWALQVRGKPVPVTFLDLRDGKAITNIAVSDLQVERSYFTGNRDWKVRVSVSNFGPDPIKALPVSIFGDSESLANGFIDLPPWDTGRKEFTLRLLKKGSVNIEARIHDDLLNEDNRRYDVVNVKRTVNVLLVNGRPSTTRHLDEVFYIKQALNPGKLNRSRIHTVEITTDWFEKTDLSSYEQVWLCHVPRISESMAERLDKFVAAGGGLFISVGPSIDVDNYNQRIPQMLPGQLRGERLAGTGTESKEDASVVYLSRLDYSHPIFRIFDDETAKSLYTARVKHYLTFDSDAVRQKRILARYTDNSPALVEVKYKEGRSLLFTSSVSRSWNDLAIQPGFLPLVQETAHFLMEARSDEDVTSLIVGQHYQRNADNLPKYMKDPSGKRLKAVMNEGAEGWISPALPLPGFYEIAGESGVANLSVNLNSVESDLRVLGEDLRRRQFGVQMGFAVAGGEDLPEQRIEYAAMLILFLLLCFAGEVMVLRWMG